MSKLEVLQTFFEYNASLNQRTRQSMLEVSPEQFVQPVGYSRGSLRDQVVHQANANRNWLQGFKGLPRLEPLQPEDYPDQPAAFAIWEGSEKDLQDFIATLTDEQLETRPEGFLGPLWQAMLHLANHATDHRAQMLRILHDFSAPTFEQDMLFFMWDVPGRGTKAR
jgi:uncharacterized damage-inducible protein DinB